jgi:hypothetical protein
VKIHRKIDEIIGDLKKTLNIKQKIYEIKMKQYIISVEMDDAYLILLILLAHTI